MRDFFLRFSVGSALRAPVAHAVFVQKYKI